MNASVYIEGLSIGLGLIVAIGAQNAFVMKQGIMHRHVLLTAVICTLIDAVLITAGVLGLGAIINGSPVLLFAVTVAGALFLAWYGIRSFIAVADPTVLGEDAEGIAAVGVPAPTGGAGPVPAGNGPAGDRAPGADVRSTVATLLAFSLLNPHVYLDTVILLGGIGARHPAEERPLFILGAASASALWFFALAYGSGLLTPLFRKKVTWRILDFSIGCVMFIIAGKLAVFAIEHCPR